MSSKLELENLQQFKKELGQQQRKLASSELTTATTAAVTTSTTSTGNWWDSYILDDLIGEWNFRLKNGIL
jgi:hypothetical protein